MSNGTWNPCLFLPRLPKNRNTCEESYCVVVIHKQINTYGTSVIYTGSHAAIIGENAYENTLRLIKSVNNASTIWFIDMNADLLAYDIVCGVPNQTLSLSLYFFVVNVRMINKFRKFIGRANNGDLHWKKRVLNLVALEWPG